MTTAPFLRKHLLQIAILLAPVAFCAALWDRFPDRVPIHWNLWGRPDGWSGKGVGLLFLPALNVAIAVLFAWLPRLDPKLRKASFSPDRMAAALGILRLAVTAFLSFVALLMAAAALGVAFNMTRVAMDAALVLLLVLGNFLGNLRPNYFIGVRTPWTLESPEVWRATHRICARILVFGSLGLLLLQFALTPLQLTAGIVLFSLGTSVWAFVYSYRISPRKTGPGP